MRNVSAPGSSVRPAALLRATPRHVTLNGSVVATVIATAAVVAGCLWAVIALERRATISRRHTTLFAAEAVPVEAEIVQVRRRGDDGRRITVNYCYTVGGREYSGARNLRRGDRQPTVGSKVRIRYLDRKSTRLNSSHLVIS